MHSWAEIEHKLAYKSEIDIPKDLRRKFSFISAVLEDADIKFEEIKNTITENKSKLIREAKENQKFNETIELNLDNLQAFLDYAFENREKDIDQTREVLNEMIEYDISFPKLIEDYEKYKDVLKLIESEENIRRGANNNSVDTIYWHQSGAIRTLMDLKDEKYFNSRPQNPFRYIIEKYRKV